MSDNESNLSPEVQRAISELTVENINSFLSGLLVPRHCHLCHGQLHVVVKYIVTDDGLVQDAKKPAISKTSIQESTVDGESYEMELPCFTLGCLRCGNLNRLTVAPVLDHMRSKKGENGAADE